MHANLSNLFEACYTDLENASIKATSRPLVHLHGHFRCVLQTVYENTYITTPEGHGPVRAALELPVVLCHSTETQGTLSWPVLALAGGIISLRHVISHWDPSLQLQQLPTIPQIHIAAAGRNP